MGKSTKENIIPKTNANSITLSASIKGGMFIENQGNITFPEIKTFVLISLVKKDKNELPTKKETIFTKKLEIIINDKRTKRIIGALFL